MSPRGPVLITAVNFRSGYKYGIVARSSPREDRIRSVFRALARSKVARARRTSIRLSTRVYGKPTLFTIFGNSRPLLPSKGENQRLSVHPLYLKIRLYPTIPVRIRLRIQNRSLSIRLFDRFENVPVRRGAGFAAKTRVDARKEGEREGREKERKENEKEGRRTCAQFTAVRCVYSVFPMKQLLFCGRRVHWRDTPERVGMERLGRIAESGDIGLRPMPAFLAPVLRCYFSLATAG